MNYGLYGVCPQVDYLLLGMVIAANIIIDVSLVIACSYMNIY